MPGLYASRGFSEVALTLMQRLGDPSGGFARVPMLDESDGQKVSLWTPGGDSLLHRTGPVKVARAGVDLETFYAVGTGLLANVPCYLYWLTYCPSANVCLIELADSTNPAAPNRWCLSSAIGQALQVLFDPPMPFTVGIYLNTFTNMTSITIGYATI